MHSSEHIGQATSLLSRVSEPARGSLEAFGSHCLGTREAPSTISKAMPCSNMCCAVDGIAILAARELPCLCPRQMHVAQVELPLGATEDRICGTIDIERALQEGIKAFEPGLLVSPAITCSQSTTFTGLMHIHSTTYFSQVLRTPHFSQKLVWQPTTATCYNTS